jgi:hypothetical protein
MNEGFVEGEEKVDIQSGGEESIAEEPEKIYAAHAHEIAKWTRYR